MKSAEGKRIVSAEIEDKNIREEQFGFGNVELVATVHIGGKGKAQFLEDLEAKTADKNIELTEILPKEWKISFVDLTSWVMGIDPPKKRLVMPLRWPVSGERRVSENVDSIWGDCSDGSTPYLSHPESVFVLFHEIGHLKDILEKGEIQHIKHKLQSMIEASSDDGSIAREKMMGIKKDEELSAMKHAIESISKLYQEGFNFGEDFQQNSPSMIREALESYDMSEEEISGILEYLQTIFAKKEN